MVLDARDAEVARVSGRKRTRGLMVPRPEEPYRVGPPSNTKPGRTCRCDQGASGCDQGAAGQGAVGVTMVSWV